MSPGYFMAYSISDECKGCGACKDKCPWKAISGEKKKKHFVDPIFCQECGTCWHMCPRCAVKNPQGVRRDKSIKAHIPKARINTDHCVGCQNCFFNCQQRAINYQKRILVGYCTVDKSACIGCGSCRSYCAGGCIELS